MRDGVTNLATGATYWSALPQGPLDRAAANSPLLSDSAYGACQGEVELLDELHSKLESENGIAMSGREVLVTSGANQAWGGLSAWAGGGTQSIALLEG